jgi:hypothetical protein
MNARGAALVALYRCGSLVGRGKVVRGRKHETDSQEERKQETGREVHAGRGGGGVRVRKMGTGGGVHNPTIFVAIATAGACSHHATLCFAQLFLAQGGEVACACVCVCLCVHDRSTASR